MKSITIPELALIAGTRAAFGAGVALLLGGRLDAGQRKAVGWTLVAIGALSTVPLAAEVLSRNGRADDPDAEVQDQQEQAFLTGEPW
jgi:hypothetical protein